MAKVFKSSLPKVISKANKDISLIIENDIASESKLLKDLVDQVLNANLEIKKKNNQRITETKRKLAELDEQITDLNSSIDLVDRETVIQQLNEMIDAENKIFAARQEIRFFENEKSPERIDNLDTIYKDLISSIQKVNVYEERFRDGLINSNNLLFDKQVEITNEIISLMDDLFDRKSDYVNNELAKMKEISDNVIELENYFNNYINSNLDVCMSFGDLSTAIFSEVDDDLFITEKIKTHHENTINEINETLEKIKTTYEAKKAEIEQKYLDYEQSVNEKLEAKNLQLLEQERKQQELIDEKLKSIRLQIIHAEKNNKIGTIQKLMKQFEKVEKSKSEKVTKKVSKEASAITKKMHLKSINQLETLELKYVTDLNKSEHALVLEQIKFEEAKILYKIKSDLQALQGDLDINKKRMINLKDFLDTKVDVSKKIYDFKLNLRHKELQIMKDNELLEQSLIHSFKELLIALKNVENARIIALKENLNNHTIIKIEQEFQVKKSIELIKLDQELMHLDKLILKMRNETLIKNEKIKEEANSEIIYQQSLIDIANKERDLQLVKVTSLYENERNLAEEQIERINLGVKVNDAFVKTTLENQLLFASQQIQCAESEHDIRVESINLTNAQELQYANKKINYYRQKYDYEKSKINKELNDKLEDLNYKLLLFTDQKDNREIKVKIKALKEKYYAMIEDIEKVEMEDEEIIRYEKVIEAANKRAEEAIGEALSLKNQTIDSFQILYDQTKQKYDLIKETDQTEETRGIMPVLNNTAVSSANSRLQKATEEAEMLFKEKIIVPQKKIEETKAKLVELISNKEADQFVEEQIAIKNQKIVEHQGLIKKLEEDKEKALQAIEKELEQVNDLNKLKTLNLETMIFTDTKYRNENDIEKDYLELFAIETTKHQAYINEIIEFRTTRLKKQEKILKDTNTLIKQTFKPYKKYIRFASKGLNAKKKELAKEYNKKLKKAHNDVENNYKKIISSI